MKALQFKVVDDMLKMVDISISDLVLCDIIEDAQFHTANSIVNSDIEIASLLWHLIRTYETS